MVAPKQLSTGLLTEQQREVYIQGLRYLARREHTEFEIAQKLKRRAFHPNDIAIAIEYLKEHGHLSLNRFLQEFLQDRLSRFVGPLKISAELRQRGIDDYLIRETLDANAIDWEELATQCILKHTGAISDSKFRRPSTVKDWKVVHRILKNRGYPDSVVLNVIGSPPY